MVRIYNTIHDTHFITLYIYITIIPYFSNHKSIAKLLKMLKIPQHTVFSAKPDANPANLRSEYNTYHLAKTLIT